MHDIQYKPEGVYTYVLREDRQRAGCVDCKPVHYGNPIKNAEERESISHVKGTTQIPSPSCPYRLPFVSRSPYSE